MTWIFVEISSKLMRGSTGKNTILWLHSKETCENCRRKIQGRGLAVDFPINQAIHSARSGTYDDITRLGRSDEYMYARKPERKLFGLGARTKTGRMVSLSIFLSRRESKTYRKSDVINVDTLALSKPIWVEWMKTSETNATWYFMIRALIAFREQ